MSTRGAYGFHYNGHDYITYNHFDSYPEGLGAKVVEFVENVNKSNGWELVRNAVSNLRAVESEDTPTKQEEREFACYKQDLGHDKPSYYQLLRNTQGDLQAMVSLGIYIDSSDFIIDSLFCEHAYIINLDDMVLEVYEGFNKNRKANGRYASKKSSDPGYYGCALVHTIPLKKVNSKMWKEFCE